MPIFFTRHTHPDNPELWLQKPVGKYKEIIDAACTPSEGRKQIDLCCGLGFGKTLLAIQIAVHKLQNIKGTRILFLEPDWDRVQTIFLDTWEEHIPPHLYHHDKGKRKFTWIKTGNTLYYRARVITGSREAARSSRRGVEFTDVIDDETAIMFDLEQYQNTLARIRKPGSCRTYITLTTPQVGPYGRFLKRGGNIIFRGRTADNHYLLERDPNYEKELRANMSEEQARRELDGELVALEGRIWKTAKYDQDSRKYAWPNGNRHDQHKAFDPNKPWWLFCDIGSATGAYVVMQQTESTLHGREMFHTRKDRMVWVAVADLCPSLDASAARAFNRLKEEFGRPAGVVGGADIGTAASTDGKTVAYFAQKTWGANIRIYPCNEKTFQKQIQYDRLSYLMCAANGERRFTIAKDFVSLDLESHRGVREMIDEDAWPTDDKRRPSDFLPKGKDNVVQHTRDALLMGAAMIMSKPDWLHDENPTA